MNLLRTVGLMVAYFDFYNSLELWRSDCG